MTRAPIVLTTLAALAACTGSPAPGTGDGSVTLSIVGTNDMHGGILPSGDRGGLALFSGYVKNLRDARAGDGAVLLIDAGDMWQGTMESNVFEGAVVVEAYNALGYTAAAIGNHEFDFGPVGEAATPRSSTDDPRGALKLRAAQAEFPLLAANLIDDETGKPVAWPNVMPSATVDAAGVTVGIIGVTTSTTFGETIRANTVGLSLAPLAAAISTEAARLRSAGADVVIVTAHSGGSCREFADPADVSSCDAGGEIIRVARALEPGLVDVIVAGHTHAGIAHTFNGIAVIESLSRGRAFGRVDLTVDRFAGRIAETTIFPPQHLCRFGGTGGAPCAESEGNASPPPAEYEGAVVEPDSAIEAVIEPAVTRVAALKAEELGVMIESRLPLRGGVESPLGNLFADAMLAASGGADLVINNTAGGLRADLPAGPLTYGRLFEVFPFDNLLVRLTLTGRELEDLLAGYIARTDRLLGIAGARVEAACRGSRVDVRVVRAGGAEIRDDETVVVATTDYLATTDLFAGVRPPEGAGPLVRDAVADWFRRRGGTVRPEDLVNERMPRFPPDRTLPLTCRLP